MKPLTKLQLEVINYIEEYWHKHSEFPPVGSLRANYGKDFNIKEEVKNVTFKKALENRGIDIPSFTASQVFPVGLSEIQIACALKFADFLDRRSMKSKLAEFGVTTTQWYGWMRNKKFQEFIASICTERFDESLPLAQAGLVSGLERGDVNAIKFYMEATGRVGANASEAQNIKVVLAKVIESIQRHVKDPEIIRAIASDFEIIMQGGTPVQTRVLEGNPI